MGIIEYLVCVSLLLIVGGIGVLCYRAWSQESVSMKDYVRVVSHPAAKAANPRGQAAGPVRFVGMVHKRAWQYKQKLVTRVNPQTGLTEQVMELVLVYE
jgi:hypothetical protein